MGEGRIVSVPSDSYDHRNSLSLKQPAIKTDVLSFVTQNIDSIRQQCIIDPPEDLDDLADWLIARSLKLHPRLAQDPPADVEKILKQAAAFGCQRHIAEEAMACYAGIDLTKWTTNRLQLKTGVVVCGARTKAEMIGGNRNSKPLAEMSLRLPSKKSVLDLLTVLAGNKRTKKQNKDPLAALPVLRTTPQEEA